MLKRYEAVLSALQAGVVIHAADTEILEANGRARELLGIHDLEGRLATDPDWVFLEADYSPMTVERFPVMQVLASGERLAGLIMVIRPPRGADVWLEVNAVPIVGSSGRPEQIAVTFIDVTERALSKARLEEQAERLELVLESSRLGLWDWNMVTGETVFDERWAQILGYRLAELEPVSIQTWIGLSHPDDLAAANALIEEHVKGLTPFYDSEVRMQHRDGHWVWVHDRGRVVEWTSDGRPLRMTGVLDDISDRVAAEAALRKSQAQLLQAQRIAHVGSWTLDNASRNVTWSRELYLMHGLDPAARVPDDLELRRLFTPASWLALTSRQAVAQESGTPYELELEMIRPDGSHGWMVARGEAVRNDAGAVVGLAGVALDVSESKAANELLQVLATHDPLTGLANRSALLDEITRALSAGRRSGRSTAVLMMDLDRFKDVNDTLGHATGDALLVAAATRVEEVVRAGDLVARLGGDEFVIVMRDLDGAEEAVERSPTPGRGVPWPLRSRCHRAVRDR